MMLGWLQLAVALVGLTREALKYMASYEKDNAELAKDVRQFTKTAKAARENGDTSEMERMFGNVINH